MAELVWLIPLLSDFGVQVSTPVLFFCDNQAAIHIAKNPVFHERTKHIEVDCHFIRHWLSQGLIVLYHVPTASQLDDVFTKPLTRLAHHLILLKLGVQDPSNLGGGGERCWSY